ncbi:hypothetical protein Glove_81g55 [Diversispora epigaea]|uniref:Endoglucanase n=1 Tax=Diversispora epigaea TaxID=1348612 RepID=A0A397JH31_9GLOM|nr:hypothetical protein Glove_81g55 [Diversispora epigaea]
MYRNNNHNNNNKIFKILFIFLFIISWLTVKSLEISTNNNISGIPQESNSNNSRPNLGYAKLLAYSLYFYEAQRSGKLPSDNRVSWRHDSALKDGQDVNLDLIGGYYDAGDYLKFTLPLSWVITSLSWGILEWGQGYRLANQSQYIHDMLKWGTDWLIKAHPESNILYVMIGLDVIDNNYWGPDTSIPYPRPSFNINSTAHGTDVAGEAAAAFAASSLVFRNYFNDSAYADILLSHAKDTYALAELTPFVLYQNSVPQIVNVYPSSNFTDELVWGALWLHRAINNESNNNNSESNYYYLNKAINYFNNYSMAGQNNVVNWDDKTGAVYLLFADLIHKYGREGQEDLSKWKNEIERYLDGIINLSTCSLTKGGLYWCDEDSKAASLNPALNAAFLLLLYSSLNVSSSTSTKKIQSYKDFAMSQIDYTLGKNPRNSPYVIGIHPNSPKNPHHGGASGGNDVSNLNDPPETKYILYGALVGGPDKKDKFSDDRADYDETEVALDYNSPFQNLMAYQVINSYVDPYYVNNNIPKESSHRITIIKISGWWENLRKQNL